jgi:hypothetical protein
MLPGSLARSSLVMIALWRVDEGIMPQVWWRGTSLWWGRKTPANPVVIPTLIPGEDTGLGRISQTTPPPTSPILPPGVLHPDSRTTQSND